VLFAFHKIFFLLSCGTVAFSLASRHLFLFSLSFCGYVGSILESRAYSRNKARVSLGVLHQHVKLTCDDAGPSSPAFTL
jgi:hypothetical protein